MSLKGLNDLHDQFKRQKYPNMPTYAMVKSKFSDSNANELTKSIMAFLELKGHHVSRVNTMGVVRQGKYTKGGGTLGASDLSVIMRNKNNYVIAWELEIKFGKDRQSDDQKEYQKSVEKAGGLYSIVRTFEEFENQYLAIDNAQSMMLRSIIFK